MQLDLLAIGAHPDDIELSCGGTVARCVKLGYKVGIVDLTKGELSTRGTRALRQKESDAAARILGVRMRENLGLPDGRIDTGRDSLLKLITLYRSYRPRVLLIPHWHERHPDHVHAHHLCREAWFYSGLRKIVTRLRGKAQDPWRPDHYFHYMQKYEFAPTFIIDVSEVFALRMDSIRAHRSQFYDPHSKDPETLLSQKFFLDFIETRARYYGGSIGVQYGEPFFSVEPIGVKDILGLQVFGK